MLSIGRTIKKKKHFLANFKNNTACTLKKNQRQKVLIDVPQLKCKLNRK